MQALRIVEPFDPIDQIEPGLQACCVSPAMHPLYFQRLEKALYRRVIPAVRFATHRLHHPILIDQCAVLVARVLNTAIGMHDQSRGRLTPTVRHGHRVADQLRFHPLAHRPADNPRVATRFRLL